MRRLGGVERLEDRRFLALVPYGAMTDDTGEYMLGDVAVSVVLMESDPSVAPPGTTPDLNTENWTPTLIAEVKTKVDQALQWWKSALNNVSPAMADDLNFVVDYTYADNPIRTVREPINRRSDDFQYWMYDFLNQVGYNQTRDFSQDIRAYNDAHRRDAQANWAFTIFVVNSTNDVDDAFASGGSFSRAFSYAGGRFMVVPSGRPNSTFAHETGHMFWARDEYAGEDWLAKRGYYNTQNLNAAHTGYTQLPSIMASNSLLNQAFVEQTSAPSTFAMIGWQDSDGDGIFDVLDVPLSLSGSGRYDASTGTYRFRGSSSVRTLPNRNSSGLQNDITINVVSRAEYRVDGGDWTTAATYGTYSAALNLTFPVPAGSHTVEIRTLDAKTGVTSATFSGTTNRPTTHSEAGIHGFVFSDQDEDATFDNSEAGWAGWSIQLVDAGGTPLNLQKSVEPDDYATNVSITNIVPGVELKSIGWNSNGVVVALAGESSTGTRGFGTYSVSNRAYTNVFSGDALQLRIDFASPTSFVSLDAIGTSGADYGRLEAYDSNSNLLARYTTGVLESLQVETMSLRRERPDIAYVLAKSHLATEIVLDNLKVGPSNRTQTDAYGAFQLGSLPAGTYTLHAIPPASWGSGGVAPMNQTVTLAEGEAVGPADFAVVGGISPWHNPSNPLDVSNDGAVTSLDALLVINDLNAFGARNLLLSGTGPSVPPPFLDVNNDGEVGPIDGLLVINALNLNGGAAATRAANGGTTGGADAGQGEDPAVVATAPRATPPAASPANGYDIRDFLASSYRWTEVLPTSAFSAPQALVASGTTLPIDAEDDSLWDDLARDVALRWTNDRDDDPHHHDDDSPNGGIWDPEGVHADSAHPLSA